MLHGCLCLHQGVYLSKQFPSPSQLGFLFSSKRVWQLGIPADALPAACQGQNAALAFLATQKADKSYKSTSCSIKCCHFDWIKNPKQTNNGKGCNSLSLFFSKPFLIILSSVANRSNFVIFLIPLLWGHKNKERVVFSSLTNCFLYKPEDYLNCSPSGPLPFALNSWKSIELILSIVRKCLSHIIHINYFISWFM